MEMGHLWMGHLLKWVGHLRLNGWDSYGKVSHCLLGDMLKNTDLQGSTLSGPRMIMDFCPFEILTRDLLRKGRDHSCSNIFRPSSV